ncbi:MAG: pilin [Candidatus Saccharibacteria bacterium]
MSVFTSMAALINTGPLPGSGSSDFTAGQPAKIQTIVFGISGAIALLIIVIAGFQYVTSQGNPQSVAKAKNAIIYAGVGLVVLILANAIVAFVVKGTS